MLPCGMQVSRAGAGQCGCDREKWAGRAGAREERGGPGRESSEDLGNVEEGGSRREPGDVGDQWHCKGSQRRMWAGRG